MKYLNLLLCLLLPVSSWAGSNPKSAVAVRTSVAPHIDGLLNEPEWKLAKPEAEFFQYEPLEDGAPSQRTEVRFLYDDEALYIGAFMHDTDPPSILARLARRDDEITSDDISVRIDSYGDNQTNHEFTINAAGVKVDILQYDDGRKEDVSWDAVWDVQTRIGEEGWVAEIKIPFQALRFSPKPDQDWGLQIVRKISRTREKIYWARMKKSESGWTSKFGHLTGISNIPAPGHVEILPYGVAGERFFPVNPGYPDGRRTVLDVGADVKFRPGNGFTLDATLNPDFGQVEADPAVLNLSSFETFYPEKRPFFIEGGQIYRFSTFGDDFGPGLFYSRRIGRSLPSPRPPANGYVIDDPSFATIVGALKLSGKTESGLSIGALEAYTREENATLVDSLGSRTQTRVEPRASYGLLRLKQDLWANSNVGLIMTHASKDERLPAFTGGLDWNLRFDDNMYRVDGFLAGSHTTTPEGAVIEGAAGKISFNKEGGENWRTSIGADFTGKKFNINDLGFFRRPNDFGTNGTLTYRVDRPSDTYLTWFLQAGYHYRNNFDGANLYRSLSLKGMYIWLNYWDMTLNAQYDFGTYDDRETRGNGLYRKPTTASLTAQGSTDSRRILFAGINGAYARTGRGGSTWQFSNFYEWKAASNFTLRLSATAGGDDRQFAWVGNVADTLIGPGTHSIFADRTVRSWDLTARGTVVFVRDLTVQIYLQLFNAKGTFSGYQRMTGEDAFASSGYTRSDFNESAFHSNVVLRWEYLPGSTLFFVWSQARTGSLGTYGSTFTDNFANMFDLKPTNVLMLKLTYWMTY